MDEMERRLAAKPRPEHVAQVCRNGHVVLTSLKEFPQFRKAFCEDCGAPTIDSCQNCSWPIAGPGPNAWMAGTGPFRPPRYCGECGTPFPWTETALKAAKDYTDELDELNAEEKSALKETIDNLTKDTPQTPVAVNRFKKFMEKLPSNAGDVLKKVLETVASAAAKDALGL